MHLQKNLLSLDLIFLFLIILCKTAYGDGVRGGDDNSVEDRAQSDDVDERLITDFLDARLGSSDEDTDVARILKLLEAVERESPTTAAPPTTTTPRPTPTPVPVTPNDSPFFKTERPTKYYSPASKRSDYHHQNHVPSLDRLLWSTGRAAWDVASPFFYATHVGRAVGLAQSTITLPFRTMGAIRKAVNDLTQNPNGQDDQKQSGSSAWHQSHGHHHFDHHAISHGWGWKNGPLYIKYEPDNSLFKSWLTYLYRILRPAVATKLRLKRYLLLVQLRYITRWIREALRSRFRPNVLVLKDAHKGWGHHHDNDEGQHVLHDPHVHYDPLLHHHDPHHNHDHHHHHDHHDHHVDVGWGWNGWKSTTTPKPATSYGPPEYKPPAPISHYEVPAHSAYGADPYPYKTSSWGWKKRESEKEASSSSAEYLKQLGTNLGSMLRFSLKDATAAASILKEMQARKSRETEEQNVDAEEVEDVPYLISESES